MTRLTRPIVILGAARSGTKMLRTVLGAHPGVSVVPWDVNFVWKYGNYSTPHDELTTAHLSDRASRFIRRSLSRHLQSPGSRLVEKTVGNTLRPGYVDAVLPDALFVHLIRDGRDVAESARRMWRAPMDWRAVLPKLRAFPPAALPTYGVQYARAYLERRLGLRQGAVSTWGPRWQAIDADVARLPLLEVCAMQWVHCVEASLAALSNLPAQRTLEVRYEALCSHPIEEARKLLEFVGLPASRAVDEYASRNIVANQRNKARLSADEIRAVEHRAGSLLARLNYLPDPA